MNGRCADCRFFNNDPGWLEVAFPGLKVLSSAYGSVRADTGLCSRHDRLLPSWQSCRDFELPPEKKFVGSLPKPPDL